MSVNTAKQATPDSHKESILQAAIAEFSRVGYAAASTNEIVRQANVSKGLLFHYFTSKEKLYIACQLHVMEEYGQYMVKHSDYSSPDFFDRILKNLYIKIEYGCRKPNYLTFINRAWFTEAKENPLQRSDAESIVIQNMKGAGQPVSSTTEEMKNLLFKDINTTLFREEVSLLKLLDYTRLVLEFSWERFSGRYNNDGPSMVQNIGSYLKEVEDIIMLIKHGAYK